MGLCSCLARCLAWGVQHWSLLVIEWSWVLALRWRSLGELSPIAMMRGQEVSGGPMSWTRLSHLRGSGLTPGWSTKTLSALVPKNCEGSHLGLRWPFLTWALQKESSLEWFQQKHFYDWVVRQTSSFFDGTTFVLQRTVNKLWLFRPGCLTDIFPQMNSEPVTSRKRYYNICCQR